MLRNSIVVKLNLFKMTLILELRRGCVRSLFKVATIFWLHLKAEVIRVLAGGAKANGREPKGCWGQVFNFKLGHFVIHAIAWYIQAHPTLELKTRQRFCPVSLSLSMVLDCRKASNNNQSCRDLHFHLWYRVVVHLAPRH